MQTHFTLAQLADSDLREADKILRACVHCGFCTATCPTYVLLGDERDSPRGRIYLIKDMLENDRPADADTVKHVDRCLTCLSCMTTCPSGVHYMHLVDHARHRIEQTYARPLPDRLIRRLLALVLPRPDLFRLALTASRMARPLAFLLPGSLKAALALAPARLPPRSPLEGPRVFPPEGAKRARVALLEGCAQKTLAPQINEATIRLLTRHGCEVVVARGAGCCGALTHHMGQDATAFAKANIAAWTREMQGDGLDAIVVNASGCGTTVKDYGFMFRDDAALAEPAKKIAALARDIMEFLATFGLRAATIQPGLRVAYHSACSLQHGQKIREEPKKLLAQCGFTVLEPAESHLCCGSAGTYNILQSEIALQLRDRKVANLENVKPDVVAAGNIGCLTQIATGTQIPVVHTVELLDWATGGPKPDGI
ncbi:glycolate oxidase subunit GlcF [Rhodoblastus sp.]|uniref:glycolate oxidase subunit GlcF n=1 Tax=Rhodoblastus sp. TaxID=1962975 RepID=UPI0035B3FC53